MNRCAALMYHFIQKGHLGSKGFHGVDLQTFRQQLIWLSKNFIPLEPKVFLHLLEEGRPLPSKSFVLSFDDGTRDHYEVAFPILEQLGLKAFFFPVTEPLLGQYVPLVEKQRLLQYGIYQSYDIFLKRFCALTRELYPEISTEFTEPTERNLNAAQSYLAHLKMYSKQERFFRRLRDQCLKNSDFENLVNTLLIDGGFREIDYLKSYYMTQGELTLLYEAGMEIGCHSHTHPDMEKLPEQDIVNEIEKSKQFIENLLNTQIRAFAFPYGRSFANATPLLRRCGFSVAFKVDNRFISNEEDLFSLPRLDVGDFNTTFEYPLSDSNYNAKI